MSRPAGQIFTICVPFLGTISADNTVDFKLPWDAELVAVSADGDTNDFNIVVGIVGDSDLYVNQTDGAVTAGTILLLDAPGDFVGDQYPHIDKDTLMRIGVIDTGDNATDVFIVCWFATG